MPITSRAKWVSACKFIGRVSQCTGITKNMSIVSAKLTFRVLFSPAIRYAIATVVALELKRSFLIRTQRPCDRWEAVMKEKI